MASLVNVSALLEQAASNTLPEYALLENSSEHDGCPAFDEIASKVLAGLTVHFYTEGAWSHHQLIEKLLIASGPAEVYVTSYAMSEAAVRMLCHAKETGNITKLYCAIDNRIETRTAGSLQLLQNISDKCALLPCHAKVTVMHGVHASIVVVGSANYTENKRLEVGFAVCDDRLADFYTDWIWKHIIEHG